MDPREQIIAAASEKMRQAGIRSVSVDDICRELGMSKKTFYVHFETKDVLIDELLRRREQHIVEEYEEKTKGHTIVELLVDFFQIARNPNDVRLVPPLYYDLRKYYPQLFEEHLQRLDAINRDLMTRYLNKGKAEKLFREDLDVELTAELCAELHQRMMNRLITAKDEKHVAKVSNYGVRIFFRGILSDEGRLLLREKLQK